MESRKVGRLSKPKIGDVFLCPVGDSFRIFQFCCNDSEQLNSDVVAVFSKVFKKNEVFNDGMLSDMPVEFYAHILISLGIKMQLRERIGNAPVGGCDDCWFRDTNDYGQSDLRESNDWWIWKANSKAVHVGPLLGKYRNSFIGVVIAPANLLDRMREGKYSYRYPVPAGEKPYTE